MSDNQIDFSDLASTLLAVQDDKSIVCGIVLDALHSFRRQGKSSRGFAQLLMNNEAKLCASKGKMVGLLDAFREYQLVHPIHHLVIQKICVLVENEIIREKSQPKPWIKSAFMLISENYDRKRLESLLEIAKGPYSIAKHYVPEYVAAVVRNIEVARIEEPGFHDWAREQLDVFDGKLENTKNKQFISESISQISSAMTKSATNEILHKIQELNSAWNSEVSKKIRTWRRFIFMCFGMLVIGMLILISLLIRPWIVKGWQEVEPNFFIIQILVVSIGFILYVVGIKISRKMLHEKGKYIIEKMVLERIKRSLLSKTIMAVCECNLSEK